MFFKSRGKKMCSAPGLPAVGSDITLHITRVNLNPQSVLLAFGGYFHLGRDTGEVCPQIKEGLDIETLRREKFEGKTGDVCCVYEDKAWHRARILSKCDYQYNVFLIDEGKLFWASSNVLTKCPPILLDLPPTVELCILGNASPLCWKTGWSEAASEFIGSMHGKSISGRVRQVMMPHRVVILDVPTVSKEMYELGLARKISDDDFKSLVTNSLRSPEGKASTRTNCVIPRAQGNSGDFEMLYQYLYPELLPGTIELVTVTHVVHPFKIFCKLNVFSRELRKLSVQLQKCYEDEVPSMMLHPLTDGSPCATKGSDGKWYRSVLQQNTGSDVLKVFHVDSGVGDFVKPSNINALSPRFFQLPVVTFPCSLLGIIDKGNGWRADQIDFLKSIVLDQVFIGKFEQQDLQEGIYKITLYGNDGVNANEVFGLKEDCLSSAGRMCADQKLETLNNVTYKCSHSSVPVCSLNTNCPTDSLKDFAAASRTKGNCKTTDGKESLNYAVSQIHREVYEISPPKIEVGTKEKVWITCVRSVSQFYGHFAQNIETVKMMTRDIQQLCRTRTQTNFSVFPTMMCFAKHPDGLWHRGQIQSTQPQITVHFVDYGNVLALDKSKIIPLAPEDSAVTSIPIQAVEFELFNVTLPQSSQLNEWFKKYARNTMFSITVMKRTPLGKLSVEMHDEKTNLNIKMEEKWTKAKKLKEETDKTCACRVFSEVMQSKGLQEHLSYTTQATEKICRKEPRPVQAQLKQNCAFPLVNANRYPSGLIDSWQQKVAPPCAKLTDLPSRNLNEGYVTEVYLSHCNSPSNFYVHLTSDEDKIISFFNELNFSQLSSAQVDIQGLQPGDVVRAENPYDGAWYRAVVQNKDDDKVQVQYIDFGNEATVTPLKIRQLEKQFLVTPMLAIHCSLEHTETDGKRVWTKEQVTAFKKAAGENCGKKVLCKFIRHDGSAWLVSLEHQGVVLEWPLFDPSHAQTNSEMLCTKNNHSVTFKKPSVKEGETVEAYASSICGPDYFWCQFKDSEELDKISMIAQEVGNQSQTTPINLELLCQGLPCLARFSDGLWYRAQVISKCSNAVSVVFIDYGNESEIDLKSVKFLSCELLERPPQSFLCQLGGFNPTHGNWSNTASDKFFEILVDEPLSVTIQNIVMASAFSKCPQYNVLVECKESLVNDLMKDCWYDGKPQMKDEIYQTDSGQFNRKNVNSLKVPQENSLPPRVIERGMVSDVYISHISSRNNFFVQLAEEENTFFCLSEQLNSEISEMDVIHVSSIQQGSLVKAVFPEDGCWYRAVVKEKTEDGMIQVEFIDFGNAATISLSNICRLDERLLSYPRFSIQCSSNIEDQFTIQKGVEEEVLHFKKTFGQVGENKLTCKFVKEDLSTWEVQIALKGSGSNSSLDNLCKKLDDSDLHRIQSLSAKQIPYQAEVSLPVKETVHRLFKKSDVYLGQTVEAFASCIAGPNYFWCQFANSEQLDQICLIAQEYGNSNGTQSTDCLGPGSLCLACFPDDLMWYRAQVVKTFNDTVSVLFIDFGNESDINAKSVKALPSNLQESPPQAFLCQLEGFASSEGLWEDTSSDHFHALIVDKPLNVTVSAIGHDIDQNIPQYSVKIEMQQCLVNELMKSFWRASVRLDENTAKISTGNVASTSEESQINETFGVPLEFKANEDLPKDRGHKVDDQLNGTDRIAKSPLRMDLLQENMKGIPESDDRVHVVSTLDARCPGNK